jgi:hypothetical protein
MAPSIGTKAHPVLTDQNERGEEHALEGQKT